MQSTLPKGQVILEYKELFNEEPPDNPIDLIKGLCKTTILGEFAGLNYFLKPKTTMYYDTSLTTQLKLLFYFSGSNQALFEKLSRLYKRYIASPSDYPLLFTRHSCLFAFEQIVHSDMHEIPGFTMSHSWLQLLRYIMAVNSQIVKRTNFEAERPRSLEEINPQMLPLNELSLDVNPLYTPYRGYRLMEFLEAHPRLGAHFKKYFEDTYKISFDLFIYELLSMYYANNKGGENNLINPVTGEKLDTSFYYSVKPEHQAMFLALSGIYPNEEIERLISIKKYPFYNAGKNHFLLLDSILLMDKSYGQFINDFWFDYVKTLKDDGGKNLFGIRDYRSAIGAFLEKHVDASLRYSYKNSKDQVIRTFDELKIQKGKAEIEITDIYLRYKKQVFIAEVKSTGFYDEEKYSGDIDKMYKNDRDNFFATFGVDQIVQCIEQLKATIPAVDPGFPAGKRCHIFPAIIVNEKALQTPLMADIFNKRFQELIQKVPMENLEVYPLTLIHVSDLEHLEDHLSGNPQLIWNVLRFHLRFPAFIPPFYNSLNRKDIKPSAKNIKQLFGELVLKYQSVRDDQVE